ncbi:MAG: response regulator [Halofilum sp. (in: g-proteobacteria)]
MATTVLIADDHELVRTGIRRLLEDLGCQVLAEVGDGDEAVARARTEKPDVALLDIHMPVLGGLEATRKIRRFHPACRIIILTAYTEGPLPKALLEAGIDGFLTKGCTLEEMQQALQRVRRGERYISRDVAQKMAIAAMEGDADSPFDRLTPRELQVALMLLAGGINRSISEALQLSPKTVTTYRQRILRKTGVRNQTDLLRLAIRYNIAIPDDVPVTE